MTDILVFIVGGLAACAVLVGVMALYRVNDLSRRESLTSEIVSQLLRTETDLIKRAGDDQCRFLRQELGDNLKNFQDITIKSFGTLGDAVTTHIRDFGLRLDTGIKAIDTRAEGIGNKLNDDIGKMREEAAKNRDVLRQMVEAKLDDSVTKQSTAARGLREELNGSFRRLGANVAETLAQLGEQQKERLENTTAALNALGEKNEKAQDALKQTVEVRLDTIREENTKKLEEMRQTVDEKLQATLETRLGESFNRVVEQLARVHEGIGEMRNLASNVGDLRNVLTNVKVRGSYGEVQLALLLEDMLSPQQFVRGFNAKPETSERVEFAIRLPGREKDGEVYLPIDAKFPREDYERLLAAFDAGDPALIAEGRKGLVRAIRKCAKDIADKYIATPRTTDFAIMFLPTESLYAEVLREPGLFDQLQRDSHVTIAGPTTLTAILGGFKMGFQSLAIEKRSREVWKLLGAVRMEFGKYNDVVGKIEKQLATAATSVENLGRRTRVMSRTLKGVELLPEDGTAQKLLGLTADEMGEEEDGLTSTFADLSGSEIIVPHPVTSETPQTSSPPQAH